MKLRSRFYKTNADRGTSIDIDTHANRSGRSPRLDHVLSGHRRQPYIHDGYVSVIDGRRTVRFHVFLKNHKALPVNKITEKWNVDASWKGDIVVMKKGEKEELVSMSKKDSKLADFAAKKYTFSRMKPELFH